MVSVELEDPPKKKTPRDDIKQARDDIKQGSIDKRFSLGMAQSSESPLARDEVIPALHMTDC